MGYNIFLDDVRTVDMIYKVNDFIVIRSYDDFVSCITENGMPNFISFDNDLGEDVNKNILPDGYSCAKWLVYESGLNIINLKFHVHSSNPVASVQIKSLLDNYINHLTHNSPSPKAI